jgi:hypothetical protein
MEMFGDLFDKGQPVTWQSVVEYFDNLLSRDDFDIKAAFNPGDQNATELYNALFGSVRGYATKHLNPYISGIQSHLISTQDKDRIEKIKKRAASALKKYSPKFDDVSPLELQLENPAFTHQDAVSLMSGLYRNGLQSVQQHKKYIKGDLDSHIDHYVSKK